MIVIELEEKNYGKTMEAVSMIKKYAECLEELFEDHSMGKSSYRGGMGYKGGMGYRKEEDEYFKRDKEYYPRHKEYRDEYTERYM